MKKIIIAFVLLFMLTGCQVQYKINIDENLNVKEEVKTTLYGLYKDYNDLEEKYITQNIYNDIKQNYKEQIDSYGYTYVENRDKDNLNIFLSKDTNFLELKNTPIISRLYSNFTTTCSDKFCSVTATAIDEIEYGDKEMTFYYITIKLPFEVKVHNADVVDKKNNTYTWYNSDLDPKKNIEFIFYKYGVNVIKQENTKSIISILIWILIIGVILLIPTVILLKIRKNSKPRL